MKIAFLMASYDTMHFFKVMADRLVKRGHTVKAFPAMPTSITGGRYSVTQCNWHTFEIDPIENYNPDRIIVWNGYHAPFSAAVSYFKEKYKVLHVEMAWLPQKGNVYYDTANIGARSGIANRCSLISGKATPKEKEVFSNIKKLYFPKAKPKKLPEKYIVVPLQLEMDTSITLNSPFFKTMDSLIGYALKMSPYPIVIKPHPKKMIDKKNFEKFKAIAPADLKDITVIENNEIDMNTLAAHSSGLIGINSTSMIEAVVHFKPMIQLGDNVFFMHHFPMWEHKKSVHEVFETDKSYYEDAYIKKLAFLFVNQVSTLNPQPWAIEKIEKWHHLQQEVK